MAEELLVVLRRSDSCGLGFSLLGTAGLPPIIYDIVENSPAAESGEVEAGDVILKVNETDVNRFSTKEVLKCLRLSADPITLKLKRDPLIKARVKHYLSTQNAHENCDFASSHDKYNSVSGGGSGAVDEGGGGLVGGAAEGGARVACGPRAGDWGRRPSLAVLVAPLRRPSSSSSSQSSPPSDASDAAPLGAARSNARAPRTRRRCSRWRRPRAPRHAPPRAGGLGQRRAQQQ
ncbi:Uncharacterized protein GBIM_03632 [Gryllus bimaculatus]|nr:Uncharacterized protein GBIM_03632 [Gryllus bimaculatus]